MLSCVWLFVATWTVAHQAPLSMGFPRQEYWSGLPCPSPGHFHDPKIEPRFPALQADSLPFELPGKPDEGIKIQTTLYTLCIIKTILRCLGLHTLLLSEVMPSIIWNTHTSYIKYNFCWYWNIERVLIICLWNYLAVSNPYDELFNLW